MKIIIGTQETLHNIEDSNEQRKKFYQAVLDNPDKRVVLEDNYGRIIAAANYSKG
jgi:transcriptional regulator with PAS, ATPase and Fis domain